MAFRLGIGNIDLRNIRSKFSWSSYWTSRSSLLYTGRSGDELIESKQGLNVKVVGHPLMKFSTTPGVKGIALGVADNGAFDIHVTGELTLCAKIKIDTYAAVLSCILGKNIAANINGLYGFQYFTDNKFYAVTRDTGAKSIASTTTFSLNTWYFLIMTIKENDKLHFYINNVEQGTGIAVGAFSAVANQFEFIVGSGNNSTGTDVQKPTTDGYIYDVRLFDHIITPTERASYGSGNIIGDEKAFYPLQEYAPLIGLVSGLGWYDVSGGARHLSSMGELAINQWVFIDDANFYCQNYGYSLWMEANQSYNEAEYAYVPYGMNGSPLSLVAGTRIPTDFIKRIDVPGDLSNFNGFPCLFDFDPNDTLDSALDIFDRSNVLIHNATSRAMDDYNASHPYRICSDNINIDILKTLFEIDYLWRLFPRMTDNSVYRDERKTFDQIAVFPTKLNNTQKAGILNFTGDLNKFYTLDYYYENRHISAQRNNDVLFCDDAGTLSLSEDGGTTILRSLDVSGDLNYVSFAHIWLNGNIFFFSQTKAFRSTDRLQSYSEITVKDIVGNDYVAGGNNVFTCLQYNLISYNGTEFLLFGCYSNDAGVENVDINLWFSDDALNLRSIYKFGTSLPLVQARHVHNVSFNPVDNTVWVQTGDDTYLGDDECHWMRSPFNGVDFNFTILASDDGAMTGTYVKSGGFVFYNNYLYWGTDKTGTSVGIWRVPYSDILNYALYEMLVAGENVLGFMNDGAEMIRCGYANDTTDTIYIYASVDGFHFNTHYLTGGIDIIDPYIAYLRYKNIVGYYVVDQVTTGETTGNMMQGQSVLMKIDKNN